MLRRKLFTKSEMRIVVLSDNFPPEGNAPANRTFAHCREWVKAGHQVTVITGNPNFPAGKIYPGYRNRLWQSQDLDGIRVVRVWTYMAPNAGFLRRTLDYVSFALTGFFAGLFEKADVIIATSPQFFTAIAGYLLSFLKRRPFIFEVRDLWPESIAALGAMKRGRIYKALEAVELFLYRKAAGIVVVTESFKRKMESRGIPSSKISVITNGIDPAEAPSGPRNIKTELGISDRFLVTYAGTLGMAHGLESMLRAAAAAPAELGLHLLVIGDGAERVKLQGLCRGLASNQITILPPVPHSEILAILGACDAALIHLKRCDTFTEVLPSKIFEAAAVKRPILLGVQGEAQKLVERYGAGICFEPESAQAFLAAVREIQRAEVYSAAQKGCEALASDFQRAKLASEMLAFISRIAPSR